jgi:uncharacterized protein (DUF1697 family)
MADATYVGLLRGINVGRSKRIAMADLRALVERLGYRDVRTMLNSGNVVFTGPAALPAAVADLLESAVARRLGVDARVTVLTAGDLAEIVDGNPLIAAAADPSRLLVAIPATAEACRRLAPLSEQEWAPEAVAIGPRAAYLWCPDGVIASRVAGAVDRLLGDAVTTRNWNTVTALRNLSSALPT